VSLVTPPEDEQERAGVQLGCWLAAAIGVTLLGLFLLGIVGLSFVILWHARIAAAPQGVPWFVLAANGIVRIASATGY
jgi:hypothetical protein